LISDIEILDKNQWKHPVLPSQTVYLNKYPYRVTIKSNYPIIKNRHTYSPGLSNILAHDKEISDALEKISGEYRVTLDRGYLTGNSHIYLTTVDDTRLVGNAFSNRVVMITGPVSVEHLSILRSKNYYCTIRKNLWLKKYDCRIDSYPRSSNLVRENRSSELTSYICENMDVHMLTLPNNGWFTRFYCNFYDFVSMLPLIKLAYSDYYFLVNKCILK
jgi:hypothetical protein